MLLGRDHETGIIAKLVDAGHGGLSSALVIVGDPGIGKTSLLDFARESATTETMVLGTVGIEGETDFAYANLADVFRPVYSVIDELPDRQAAALASAFAIGPPDAVNRNVVAAGALSLFSALAGRAPVIVTVDDAQWVDRGSLEALVFVANRLGAEGIAMFFAVRRGHEHKVRLRRFGTLELQGLAEADARRLLGHAGRRRLSSRTIDRLVEEAGGNPLALLDLPGLLSAEMMAGLNRGLEPMPIAATLEEAYCGSIHHLPEKTQRALILLATLGSVPATVTVRAFQQAGLALADLEPAEHAGFVQLADQPRFRHPLMRAAVYQSSTPSRRRRAHLVAANALTQGAIAEEAMPNAAERRAWHLVSAGGVAEEDLARSIESTAEEELTASNYEAAGTLFAQSARLTADDSLRTRRLIQAANAMRLSGGIADALALLERARTACDRSDLGVVIEYMISRLQMWGGSMPQSRNRLLELAFAARGEASDLACHMLSDAALASIELGDLRVAHTASRRAVARSAEKGEVPLAVVTTRALVLALEGRTAAAREWLDPRADEIDHFPALTMDVDEQLLIIPGLARLAAEEAEAAGRLLERSVSAAREASALGVLPFRLGRLAWVELWRGQWTLARAAAHEAVRLAEDTGWEGELPNSFAALAQVEALTGREQECRDHAAQAIARAEQTGELSYGLAATAALGSLELTLGHHATARHHLARVAAFAEETGLVDTPLMWWSADLVESCLGARLRDEAQRVVRRMESAPDLELRPTAAAVTARCRALLEPEAFQEHIGDALAWHARAPMPFEQARTELVLGRFLRRHRNTKAREHLLAALTAFEGLGASGWAEAARRELAATGLRVAVPRLSLQELTAQELQITLAVARGLSNREIAGELFLSVKTIEYHLRNVFHKLGIHRRTQLVALVAREDPDAGT